MVATPWGNADTLRDRRLPPGRGGDRQAARREQRERLFGAMVASCSERGYEATSVEDLLRISGVSRATFYEQFDDKLDCFRAAEREIVDAAIEATAAQLGGEGDETERARAALEAFVRLIVAQPAAARMCLVEAYAAGEDGVAPVREAAEQIVALGRDTLDGMPGHGPMPLEIVRGIIGGFYQVIYSRLHAGREAELPDLVPQLWDWAMSFPPPTRELRRPGRLAVVRPIPSAAPFASHSAEQRIIRGFAAAVAAHGYPGATIAEIVAASAISQTTFYEHFEGKVDCMEAALDSSGAQLMAAVLPPVRRVDDWRAAARVGFEEVCGFFAAEPDFAALRMVAVYSAGPEAISRRDAAGMEIVRALLAPAPLVVGADPLSDLVLEATVGATLGILFESVRSGDTEEMPRLAPVLTYVTLSPFIGAEEAADVATGRGRGGAA